MERIALLTGTVGRRGVAVESPRWRGRSRAIGLQRSPGSTPPAVQRAIAFEQPGAELTARLIRLPVNAVDSQIQEVLRALGEQVGTDRASGLQKDPSEQILTCPPRSVADGHVQSPGP